MVAAGEYDEILPFKLHACFDRNGAPTELRISGLRFSLGWGEADSQSLMNSNWQNGQGVYVEVRRE